MTPSENIRTTRFADELRASVRMLNDPNVANLINGRWAPRGSTVGELIDHRDQNGLRFGPPTPSPSRADEAPGRQPYLREQNRRGSAGRSRPSGAIGHP
jgi:hypothetical protein